MIQFLNPILLAGAVAVVVPIVLHLLSRSRFRNVDWGGMMFLPGGDGKRRQASRLRQWALLSTRCALLAALALAMALPHVVIGHNSGSTLAVIILDRSASMGVIENDRSRMDRAREAATNVLAALHPGDQAALDRCGGERKQRRYQRSATVGGNRYWRRMPPLLMLRRIFRRLYHGRPHSLGHIRDSSRVFF